MEKKEQNLKKTRMGKLIGRLSIRSKLIMVFGLTAALMFVINILLYVEINRSMKQLDGESRECYRLRQDKVLPIAALF